MENNTNLNKNTKFKNNKYTRKYKPFYNKKPFFIIKDDNFYFDYKDIELLKKFINYNGLIKSRIVTKLKLKYQKRLAKAIKRAKEMALLPYIID